MAGVSSYPYEFIGGQELQGSGHRVSRNLEEYLQNLLAKQAIIDNVEALREEVGTRT